MWLNRHSAGGETPAPVTVVSARSAPWMRSSWWSELYRECRLSGLVNKYRKRPRSIEDDGRVGK
jgi:hypothetical protein